MKEKILKQSGFSPIVIILIVVALGIIGLVAWRVYDATTQANKSFDSASKSSDVEPIKDEDKKEEKTKKLVIPYVDYEIEVPDSLNDLVFKETRFQDIVEVSISTSTLVSLDEACTAEEGSPLGWVGRYPGTYANEYPNGAAGKPLLRQDPDHYIAYIGPQGACSANEEVLRLTPILLKELRTALNISN